MGTSYSRRNKRSSRSQSSGSFYIVAVSFLILNTAILGLLLVQGYTGSKNGTQLNDRIIGLEEKVERIETSVATTPSTMPATGGTTNSTTSISTEENLEEEQPTVPVEQQTTIPSTAAVNEPVIADNSNVAAATTPVVTEPVSSTHIVQSGDTLSRIAETYGVSVSRLIELNQLPSETVVIGQELILN